MPDKTPQKIAILGSRGIPNHYGGFEQFAEYLSVGLQKRGMEVWVYNSHNHPCQYPVWNGINRILCFDPEYRLGQFGQFIYDLNCINDSRSRGFDVILQLGTTSNSIWHWRLPRKPGIITNMDGLEWKRAKYSRAVRQFLLWAEKLAVKSSDHLVADNAAIGQYLNKTYGVNPIFIAYGAEIAKVDQMMKVIRLNAADGRFVGPEVKKDAFYLLIARLQPDNHIEEIIQGVLDAVSAYPLLVVGNNQTRFGRYLTKRYASEKIVFTGAIYKKSILDQLRVLAKLYFHGHSAGGTNPSLLEAMAASAVICAHDNPFNRSVLGMDAFYFSSPEHISTLLNGPIDPVSKNKMVASNLKKIGTDYNWDKIIDSYSRVIRGLCNKI